MAFGDERRQAGESLVRDLVFGDSAAGSAVVRIG